jgi:hypothetical protein
VADNSIEFLSDSEATEALQILVREASGRLIHQEHWNKASYQHTYSIDKSIMNATGVYLISIEGVDTHFTQRGFIP